MLSKFKIKPLRRNSEIFSLFLQIRSFSPLNNDKSNLHPTTASLKINESSSPAKLSMKAEDGFVTSPSSSSAVPGVEKAFYVDAQQKAVFATKIGGFANISLAISKGIIGLAISSTALVADAVNSAGDVIGDMIVYYAVKEARKKASPDRPWGKGKLEPLGALTVGTILGLTGLGIGYTAFTHVLEFANIAPNFDLLEYFHLITPSGVEDLPETINKGAK
jgi:hypothetical protein